MALPNQNKVNLRRAKKASSIQYAYRRSGTHARVFSQTLAHGNSMNERRQAEKVKMERSKVGMKKS